VALKQKKDGAEIYYSESKAAIGTIEIKVLATGTVQPENRLEIKSPIAGRIEKILVDEGWKVRQGQILAWMSSTERAALIDAARAKGKEEMKKWEEIYPPTPILAPINGTIILRSVEQGQSFTSSDSLMTMSDRLTVKAQVDETDIASVQLKQEAEIVLDAYPDQKIPAQVDKLAFDATTVSNVTIYIVDVLPKSVPSFMRSGMTANVTFFVNSKNGILLVPNEALKIKDGTTTILVRDGDRQIEKEVITGVTDGKKIEIVSGLSEGEIVLSPQIKLQDKTKSTTSPFTPMRGVPKR
jgi:macrolide-specific efflux system membrane fusion protein